MKTKHFFILAVLLVSPSLGAFAQQAANSISIQVITTFDYPGDGNSTIPEGINERGDITGFYTDSSGISRGFVRFADGTFSAPIVEPNDPGVLSEGRGINNQRTVGGYYTGSDGFFHGYFRNRGVFTEFNVSGATATLVEGLNDAGDFVGGYDTAAGDSPSFSNIGGITTTIIIPDALGVSFAFGINQSRQITGWYTDTAGGVHGWWQDSDGTINAPFDPPGSLQTLAFGINDQGLIVGRFARNRAEHGFLFRPSTNRFVLFDYPGAIFTSLNGINKEGLLCGRYDDGSGLLHGILAQVVTGQ